MNATTKAVVKIDASPPLAHPTPSYPLLSHPLFTPLRHQDDRPGLVICVIGDKLAINAKALYPAIKRWSHSDAWQMGVPTQVIRRPARRLRPASSPRAACISRCGVMLWASA